MTKNRSMIICFLAPAVLLFLTIFLYPIAKTMFMSFFRVEGLSDAFSKWKFNGLSNYVEVMKSPAFKSSMVNLMKIWIVGGIAVMFISLLFAAILTSGVAGKSFYRAVIYLPNIINAVAMASMWINFVFQRRFGLLHSFFDMLGLKDLAMIDYMNGSNKFWSLLTAYCFGSVGYYMLIFMSGIESIPADLYEAATIDGANRVRQFFSITLQLLQGVFKSCITFWTVGTVGFFVWSRMWYNPGNPDQYTLTPFVHMYQVTFGSGQGTVADRNAGVGAAIGMLMTLIVLIVFFAVNKLFKHDRDLEF